MATCKKCGFPMVWRKRDGRWYGENPDGTDHWDRCSAARWQQVSTHGTRMTTEAGGETVTGYHYKGKLHREQIDPGQTITGELYQPFTCVCPAHIMAWDECPDCPQQQAWLAQHVGTDPLLSYLDRL